MNRLVILICWILYTKAQNPLKVGTYTSTPFVESKNGELSGYCIDVWEEISNTLNINYTYTVFNSVNEVINAVETGVVDIGIGDISVTASRNRQVSFTSPIYPSGLFYMSIKQQKINIWSVFGPFSWDAWLALGATVVVFGVCHYLIEMIAIGDERKIKTKLTVHKKRDSMPFPGFRKFAQDMLHSVFWAYTTALGEDVQVNRKATWFILIACRIFSVLVISTYTASLAAFLVPQNVSISFSNIEDARGKDIGTVVNTTSFEFLKNVQALVGNINVKPFPNINEAKYGLDRDEIKAIVFDYPTLLYVTSLPSGSNYGVSGNMLKREHYSVAITKNFQNGTLLNNMNIVLDKMNSIGLLSTFRNKWWKPTKATSALQATQVAEVLQYGLLDVISTTVTWSICVAFVIIFAVYSFIANRHYMREKIKSDP